MSAPAEETLATASKTPVHYRDSRAHSCIDLGTSGG
jgi:hypothetical protein